MYIFCEFSGNLLQEEKINSVFLLYLMAIPSFCILAVAALVLENWTTLQSPHHYDGHLWVFIVLSCLGSVLYNLASCSVISLTSAVTLHILGNLSVVGNLLLSQLLFGSQLSAMSCAGVVLTLSGMIMYQNSEFIVAYVDSRRTKASNGTICTDEVEPYPGCTYETSSYLDPPQEPSLELSSELFSTELLSTEPSLELYDDSEPWEELYIDLEPPTVLERDLEASSKLYHDLQTPPELNHVQEPHAVLDHDLKPSSEVCRDLKRSSEPPPILKQDLEPSLELDYDLEPSFEIDHELEPSSELVHDLEPSSELDHDLE
ncbi:solute carrier family 35 member E4 isoform X1 [Tachysurus ichikawai]